LMFLQQTVHILLQFSVSLNMKSHRKKHWKISKIEKLTYYISASCSLVNHLIHRGSLQCATSSCVHKLVVCYVVAYYRLFKSPIQPTRVQQFFLKLI
jgi:hypothetical protein